MNLFDIVGPVMVGPSSSHTAGAARIGLAARKLLMEEPKQAHITLYGSFSSTGVGHGTDRALVAGLLGMEPDDMRIPKSFEAAEEAGLSIRFSHDVCKDYHPNTAVLDVSSASGRRIVARASSLGGGRIMIDALDGVEIHVTGERPVVVIHNVDQPGCVSEVTSVMASHVVNIATMTLHRSKRGGTAVMVIEMDQNIGEEALARLERIRGILKVTCLNL